MDNNTASSVVSVQKTRKSNKIWPLTALIVFFSFTFFVVILGYSTGLFSYIRRKTDPTACLNVKNKNCDNNLSLSLPTSVLDVDLVSGIETILRQRVVFAVAQRENYWVWSYDNLLTSLKITNETRFGLSVFVKKDDLKKNKIMSLIQSNQVEAIDEEYQDAVLLNNRDQSGLTRQQFKEIMKGGNLIEIIYNENTKELVEVRILDFERL